MPLQDGMISARQLCSNSVDTRIIAPDAITDTEIAVGFAFVELVSTLPVSGNFAGRMAFLTTDKKVYRHDGTAWLIATDGADIEVGTIGANKIVANSLTAGEIQAGAIGAAEMASINMTVGKHIRSTTYTPGSAGWSIEADGSAEFDNVIVRGEIDATSGDFSGVDISGTLTMTSTGKIRTAASGARLEIATGAGATFIDFFDSVGQSGRLEANTTGPDFFVINFDVLSHEPSPTGGSAFWSASSSAMQMNVSFVANDDVQLENGTAALPTLTFQSQTSMGMYRVASNTLGLIGGSSKGIKINTSHILTIGSATGDVSIRHTNPGSATGASYTFVNDDNTGMYRSAADNLGFTTGGSLRVNIGNSELSTRGGAHFLDYAPASAGTIDAQWFNAGGAIRRLDVVSSALAGKQDVIPLDEFIDTSRIFDLDLIAFRMKEDPEGPIQIGTSASSVGQNMPGLAFKTGGAWNFGSYSRLVVPLIAEVSKLRDRVAVLEAA